MAQSKFIRGYGQSCYNAAASTNMASTAMWQNAPSFYCDPHRVVRFFDDFVPLQVGSTGRWIVTNTGSTTTQAGIAVLGGLVALGGGATDNDTANMYAIGSAGTATTGYFRLNASLPMWFEARFSVDDNAEHGIFLGLAGGASATEILADDTLILDAANVTAAIGFDTGAGSTDSASLNFVAADGGTRTELIADVAALGTTNTTFITAGFYWDGANNLDCWINGAKFGTYSGTTGIPDDAGDRLIPVLANKVGTTDAANLYVDYVHVLQLRG